MIKIFNAAPLSAVDLMKTCPSAAVSPAVKVTNERDLSAVVDKLVAGMEGHVDDGVMGPRPPSWAELLRPPRLTGDIPIFSPKLPKPRTQIKEVL